jgi:hypothetical protein
MVSIQVGTTLFEQMRFNRNTVNYFSNSTLMSTNVCTMNKESTLYLYNDLCQNSNDNVLHEIYATETESGSMITYYNIIPEMTAKKYTGHKGFAQFWLTDEDEEALDLNGLNMNFTLMFCN